MADQPTQAVGMNQQAPQAGYAAAAVANMKSDTSKIAARVFRSNIPSVGYVFKNGKRANFIGGRYTTSIKHEIDELDAEIANSHPNFTANVEEVVETSEPMAALREKFIAEYLEQQARNTDKGNDAGTSKQGKLNVANSTTIGAGAAGSDSATGGSGSTPGAGLAALTINAGK